MRKKYPAMGHQEPRPLHPHEQYACAPCLSLPQLLAAAARLDAADKRTIAPVDWLLLAEEALDALSRAPYRASPLLGFEMAVGGKKRQLARPTDMERLIEEAARPCAERLVEPHLTDSVHGYRKGRSTFTAAEAVQKHLLAGRHHVLTTDIENFFPSIPWGILHAALDAVLPADLLRVIRALVSAPVLRDGQLVHRERGLPLGRPLSPLLSNAVLLDVDAALHGRQDVGYVRYADDIMLLAESADALNAAHDSLSTMLRGIGLKLSASKTGRLRYEGSPIPYLGQFVSSEGVLALVTPKRGKKPRLTAAVDPATRVREQPRTLYIESRGIYLRVSGGHIQVRKQAELEREVPLRRTDRVMVVGSCGLSSGFVNECLRRSITLVLCPSPGRPAGILQAADGVSPLRRRAQYDLVAREEIRFDLALDIVRTKVQGQYARTRRKGSSARVRETLRDILREMDRVEITSIDQLMGYEGAATAAYYEAFAGWIRQPGFTFSERSKRPPLDPINSLLSFGYTLLFSEGLHALLAHGLDPYPGFLHALHRTHPALASDLVEPLRATVVDGFVLGLVNRGRVKPSGFEQRAGGGVYMNSDTRRMVIGAWEAHMRRAIGPGGGTARDALDDAALSVLDVVLGEADELRLDIARAA